MSEPPAPLSGGSGNLRAEQVLSEIHVNLLECKVCFEKFTVQLRERRPRNLPCGHVLCQECVSALSHPRLHKLECPFCRQLCDAGSTSDCWALTDLQELLLSRSPRAPVPHHSSGHRGWAAGLGSGALRLHSAFGGWGRLINPTGLAVFGSSGAVAVVHDCDRRVAVFSPQGRRLHSFGRKGRACADLCHPLDVTVAPGGYVAVTDAGNGSLKVFTSRGSPVVTVQDCFQLPWGVAVDRCGHILVVDAQAGTLTQVAMDFARGVVLESRAVLTELQCPRSVACCRVTGNTAVVEHLRDCGQSQGGCQPTRLTVFNKDFALVSQVDTFSLSLKSAVQLSVSAVAFDRGGDVIVADAQQGAIWSLGKMQKTPVLTPLVNEGLAQPVGLVATAQNILMVLDSGDHTVKMYSANSVLTATKNSDFEIELPDRDGDHQKKVKGL